LGELVVVAMSGGVDSSVAALLAREAGFDVIGVTLRLVDVEHERGCCSIGDVEDARSVAALLGIRHVVADRRALFARSVVAPYLQAHRRGLTPNPCMACNRYVKVTELAAFARRLGARWLATGHYARTEVADGHTLLARARDARKDQSYVLADVPVGILPMLRFPLGELTKDQVREHARRAGLAVWDKRDSQEVCFVEGGRAAFVGARVGLTPTPVVDETGHELPDRLPFELATVGQRVREPGVPRERQRYVLAKEPGRIRVGPAPLLETIEQPVDDLVRYDPRPLPLAGFVQVGAHAAPVAGALDGHEVRFAQPTRRVAPGQRVVLYDEADRVLASARVVVDG